MRVTGHSGAVLALLRALCVLLLAGAPAWASGGPPEAGQQASPAAATTVPQAPARMLDVPDDELAERPPAESPPEDFSAAQYIDSQGCVFVRTDQGWRARIARDGSTICGYPPTFSARRTGPDTIEPLFPQPEEPRAQRIERSLTEAILPNLHDGELLASAEVPETPAPVPSTDAAQPPVAPAPATAPAPAQAGQAPVAPRPDDPLGFAAAVAHAPALAGAAGGAGAGRTDRLCQLIGASPVAEPGLGHSSALGFCGRAEVTLTAAGPVRVAAAADSDAALRAEAPRKDARAPAAPRGSAVSRSAASQDAAAAPAARRKAASARSRTATGKAASEAAAGKSRAASGPRRPAPAASGAGMIPAGARYVQVGSFREAGNASRTVRRLTGMGLPVVKAERKGVQQIMVGPLPGREAIVRTIDRLRRAGYRDAYAR